MGTVSALPSIDHHVFWGEMAPCEHVVQIYGDDSVFLDSLEGFVAGGPRRGGRAIVIATTAHLHGLEKRMREHGVDVEKSRRENRYIARLAEEVLHAFMVNGWP